MFWCHGVLTNQLIFKSYFPRFQTNHMRPYLIIDVTGSLYYHENETKMADSSEDELSDSFGNLSVVSDKDFEVFSSSEDCVREDELEIEHGSTVSRPLSGKRKSSQTRGPELHLKFPANSNLKINKSVKTP